MIYEAIMSKGDKIKIDEEDLQKLQENIKAPFIRVKQAIINPSFLVMIIPTNEPETKITYTYKENIDGSVMITGEEERAALADLMSINKKLK